MSALLRLVLLCCLGAATSVSAATFTFRFNDGPGEGFNDTTPFTPVGGNTATTLGQARKNMLMEAGRVWGRLLISDVPIVVEASFSPQECDADSGTLASAGARTFFRDFVDNIDPDVFYASALADSLAGEDLMLNTDTPDTPDIQVTFNLSVDDNPNCLRANTPRGPGFYYGFDHNRGTGIDALIVALHELAHGFGFSSEIDLSDGTGFNSMDGQPRFSSYVLKIFDEQLGRAWPLLAPSERVESAVRSGQLAWDGSNVRMQSGPFRVTSQGRFLLHAPETVSQGSSVSHWDANLNPRILMQPDLSAALNTSVVDLTVCALRDIGWQTAMDCLDSPPARGGTPVPSSLAVTLMEDTPTTITLMATDFENDFISFVLSRPLKGVIRGAPAPPVIRYTPVANATGSDSFSFSVSDGQSTNFPATVTITITPVNDAPQARSLLFGVISGQASPIPLSGSDVDGDSITFEVLTNPVNGTLSGAGATRTYASNTGFAGTDSFTYRVRDATTVSAAATVTINVVGAATPTPTPAPAPTRSGGGGGGAMNGLLLLALALLAAAARFGKAR